MKKKHPLGGKAKISKQEKSMFYSHCLLSKKGHLGTIWVAAHCLKRLKKYQIKQTDISSYVDRILHDEVEVVTYRILAYLLLGVVRIFAKKVDFLFHDCHDVMRNLKDFAGGKIADESIEAMRTSYHSITLPDRFELDAFDLGVLIDQDISSCNVRAPEDIMLPVKEGVEHSNKYYCNGDNPFEAYSTMYTPVKDLFSRHFMDIDLDVTPSRAMDDFDSRLEKLHGIRFSLEERLEPMIFHEAEKESGIDMPSNEGHQTDGEQIENPDSGELQCLVKSVDKEQSMENLSATSFPLEESLKPRIFSDRAKESQSDEDQIKNLDSGTNVVVPDEGFQTNGEQIENIDAGEPEDTVKSLDKEQSMEKLCGTSFPVKESLEPRISSNAAKESQTDEGQMKNDSGINVVTPEKFDKEQYVESEEMRFPEMTSLTNQITAKHPMSIAVNSGFYGGSAAVSPEFMAVRTPATKERARVLKKRKCVFDDTIILSNKLVKHSIDNSRDLVCKRRKAPHTKFHAWKAHKTSNIPQSFFEPLIPWNSVAFQSVVQQEKLTTTQPVDTAEICANNVIAEVPTIQVHTESSIKDRCEEQTPIAPTTPITRSTSLRLHEVRGASRTDISEPASSSESIGKQTTLNEDKELEAALMDEEINSNGGDTHGKIECSVRARKVGRYLYEKFKYQKRQQGDVFINLTQVLKGKSRKESARVFYEILVVKTRDYIDVMQEKAFGDILLLETSELKNTLDIDGVNSGA
ncbi:hypothetical protein ACH5RR_014534 [Cinchona calisaya]|uniref:Sister chromatid cohesion 1 protein 2 n=1 Tax=Cinchona calisaya TaxID=153742 RepID=A0ABD3A5R6_9GENT